MNVFSLTYLGPISYFSQLRKCDEAIIDLGENYRKQTYRNRCHICGPNGLLKLSIPIDHSKKEHTPTKDIKISYNHNWQILHWRSIESAYRRSPYFEFYEDRFASYYNDKKPKYLIDFTVPLFEQLIELIGLKTNITYSKQYISKSERDFRDLISPKVKDDFIPSKYIQVFENKTGHVVNPSIVDLLFNEGPQTLDKL